MKTKLRIVINILRGRYGVQFLESNLAISWPFLNPLNDSNSGLGLVNTRNDTVCHFLR